jgi:hypothetical protein
MSLNIYPLPPTEKFERARFPQRVAAIFGLVGLVLAWAVVLLPCAVWLLFSLVANRFQATRAPQEACQEA